MTKITKEAMREAYDGLHNTFVAKNTDYGNSFEESLDTYGMVASVVRMGDKFSRLQHLSKENAHALVASESLVDTLLDLANYAVMTAVYLQAQNDEISGEKVDDEADEVTFYAAGKKVSSISMTKDTIKINAPTVIVESEETSDMPAPYLRSKFMVWINTINSKLVVQYKPMDKKYYFSNGFKRCNGDLTPVTFQELYDYVVDYWKNDKQIVIEWLENIEFDPKKLLTSGELAVLTGVVSGIMSDLGEVFVYKVHPVGNLDRFCAYKNGILLQDYDELYNQIIKNRGKIVRYLDQKS